MREFITAAPEKVKQRGAATGNGDGLQMARAAGAQLVGMNRFYGHVLAQDAMRNDDLWPFPIMDFVCTAGVVVDAAGRRFVDEGLGGVFMTNSIAGLADPLAATVVFDGAIWDGPGREFISPANPLLVTRGARYIRRPILPLWPGNSGFRRQRWRKRLRTTTRRSTPAQPRVSIRREPPRRTARMPSVPRRFMRYGCARASLTPWAGSPSTAGAAF